MDLALNSRAFDVNLFTMHICKLVGLSIVTFSVLTYCLGKVSSLSLEWTPPGLAPTLAANIKLG